ncbi:MULTISPECIES: cytochrome c oxidase accessory protein CcoG [unclassified Sphingomonas]|uniref:cytochrome c oxidase accessory protein CcoG n=1 Tax=unclassified Sphingomonas TaxID=196159 RepID=UPI000925A0B9|nr:MULTISPECIES: cytochrome c oxidase accessory protein CcoG [unclassified Sphingomonas]MBN8848371.1 cytochrome c oxidase accessory protein CcoG [Sphingomonas sp.]OJV31215.1 MAG: cytochrome c oxidase accessory protein CcoG [Sphingomonas sp. 67-36]
MSGADVAPEPKPRFFEARRKVFPRRVDGTFRRLKWAIMAVTLAIYYVTPWLRWHRGEYAPDQAVLVDLAHRRFYMFSIEIWPNEFYYVVGLLIMAAVGLFLVTSAVGRAWCGYACPQTVWTDLFVHVERAIEGDRNAQIRLDRASWGVEKIAKRGTKFVIWLLIAMTTGGAWIFYFADAPTLAREFLTGTAPFVAYSTVGILTFTTFTLGGLMREQVCIYMCPWPRIQSAMMDEKSLAVTYKDWRGEPRTHGLKRAQAHEAEVAPSLVRLAQGEKVGDCIDCNACVAVCPTGIDIREGPQIGCITCGLCIDACDEIMEKVDRPTRLIGYTTEADMKLARAGGTPMPPLKRLLRPRTIIYFLIWAGIGCGMLFALGTRTHMGVSVLQTRNPLWVRLSDGAIRNTYTVKLRNMEGRPRSFAVSLSGIDARMWADGGSRETAGKTVTITVPADRVAKAQIFVVAPAQGAQRSELLFTVTALDGQKSSASDGSYFERPEGNP